MIHPEGCSLRCARGHPSWKGGRGPDSSVHLFSLPILLLYKAKRHQIKKAVLSKRCILDIDHYFRHIRGGSSHKYITKIQIPSMNNLHSAKESSEKGRSNEWPQVLSNEGRMVLDIPGEEHPEKFMVLPSSNTQQTETFPPLPVFCHACQHVNTPQ